MLSSDALSLCLALLLILPGPTGAAPARATGEAAYEQVATGHFLIAYEERDAGLARRLAAAAEEIREKVIAVIGYEPRGKTRVVLAPTLEEFQDVQPGREKLPLWAAAAAYPELNLIILRSPRAVKNGRLDYRRVLAHEFSHIVLGRALAPRSVPTFLSEGIAMYIAAEWHFSRMAVLTRAALTNRMIPLANLMEGFPSPPEEAELAYAESFMFISFLINTYGEEAVRTFIKDYSRVGNLSGALQRMAGKHLVVLEDEWRDYIYLRVSWLPMITSAISLWFVIAMIFLYGYFRKRRRAAATLRQWEEEERENPPPSPEP
ncbi:MAG: peptidase MA family metallohydrolase [Pseudomonadota bacterium]|nr:peptidase MA family metallohydrolase [Pseudomonadota bacterium]